MTVKVIVDVKESNWYTARATPLPACRRTDFDAHALRTPARDTNLLPSVPEYPDRFTLEATKTIAGDAFLQAMLVTIKDAFCPTSNRPTTPFGKGIWSQQSRDTDIRAKPADPTPNLL